MQARNSILFTNLFLAARTGSELHTLQLAQAFKEKGWDVTCYALIIAYPLQAKFKQFGIRTIQYGNEEQLSSSYDVLFAQHHLVSDFIFNLETVSFKTIVVSILGINGMEDIPSFFSQCDIAVFVSEEARRNQLVVLSKYKIPSRVFPNYATRDYFRTPLVHTAKEMPKRIAVISNHVAPEIHDLAEQCKSITFDLFGYENKSIEISPEIIAEYDLVITIGRTVQCCFAEGVPVYCYDHFGGPGYLSPSDIEAHAFFNFSGRSEPIKLTVEELKRDILSGYEEAVRNVPLLQALAKEKWDFDRLFEDFFQQLNLLTSSRNQPLHTATFSSAQKYTNGLLCATYRNDLMSQFGSAQLFWDNGYGIREEDSSTFLYRYNTEIIIHPDHFGIKGSLARFDPDIKPCIVSGLNPLLFIPSPKTTRATDNPNSVCFLSFDPQFFLCDSNELHFFSFFSQPLSPQVIVSYLEEEISELESYYTELNKNTTRL